MSSDVIMKYRKGVLDANQVQKLVDEAWAELSADRDLQEKFKIDATTLTQRPLIRVATEGQGITGAEVAILIGIHVAGSIAYASIEYFWLNYILPKIKSTGEDNIGEKID